MKLSEAIREGAKLSPQAFGDFLKAVPGSEVPGTCALGAAYQALVHQLPVTADDPHCLVETTVFDCCGLLSSRRIPDLTGEARPVVAVVISLNDDARWTREAIADYLAEQGL